MSKVQTYDQWGNVYFSLYISSSPSPSATVGNIKINDEGVWKNIEDLAVDQQELAAQEFLKGESKGGCASLLLAVCAVQNGSGNKSYEGGLTYFGLSMDWFTYTWQIYDN